MPDHLIQASFNSGEWSPKLFARVDLAKYRSGAALLQNYFVDYRGGASTRPGTKYILQCFKSATAVRLIPFQASFAVGYVLEFGNFYVRFFSAGAPVLEATDTITGITNNAGAASITVANAYSVGDWVFITGVVGATQLNGNYFIVTGTSGAAILIADLAGTPITFASLTTYISGGTTARVYTITSPYAAADLALLKYAQNVGQMVICHPSYAPYSLVINSPTSWTLAAITFGSTSTAPGVVALTSTSLAAGPTYYAYQITAIDANGQESTPGGVANFGPFQDLRSTAGSINIGWTASTGAVAYNVYKSNVSYVAVPPVGITFGFIGSTTGLAFSDSNISPDFTQTPPIARNPFAGGVNPSVPGFFQQRLVLAAPTALPSTFYMSQPGSNFNYNISTIAQADDSITGTLVSGQLNTIKSMVPQTSGLLMFTDRTSWLINGGSPGSAVSPVALVANPQSFNGISDIPPIIANFDVLYVQAKGSIVRDSAYNIYANVYTGTDITAISSHLFYGFTVTGWTWAEEPFKILWAIRSDGVLLTLTFLKEQEFIGWAHSTTQGLFQSVTTIIENTFTAGEVDAVYLVVQRVINGHTVKYIERVVERTFPLGVVDAWCVDCGISYSGAPATTFSGAGFLANATVTGLADGVVIPPFTMPASGTFTLSAPASKVVVGLGYTCDLQTLPLEMGDPTIQGKVKKINAVDVRVADTLGLSIGADFSHLVPMKDLIVGNVSSMLTGQQSQITTDLVNGDARTFLSPAFTVPGQYCIRQSQPLPATILGVIPDFTVGDDGGKSK